MAEIGMSLQAAYEFQMGVLKQRLHDCSGAKKTAPYLRRQELKDTIRLLELLQNQLEYWSDHCAMLEMELKRYQ